MSQDVTVRAVDRNRSLLEDAALRVWERPEGPFQERFAASLCADILEKAGFSVERGFGGLETAVRAQCGSGSPVIGFLGEYDALPGLSQKVSVTKEPVVEGGYGHGCGHNLIAAAALGAALGLQAGLKAGAGGTVVFYGCPGEEALTGKGLMASKGAFYELDAALAFHPSRFNRSIAGTLTGVRSVKFHFSGKTAHAAGDPHNGRSALDAVELTNVGANYLREHIPSDVRMHYVIIDGGTVPNVVPDKACVWYYIRALSAKTLDDVYIRLGEVAKGAAIMTGTSVKAEFLGGCYPTAFNRVITGVLDRALRETETEPWTPEETAFAGRLNQTDASQYEKALRLYGCEQETELFSGVLPVSEDNIYGSSDAGDVCHIVPTGWIYTACYNLGAPGHSWQIASCAGSPIGLKGMITAGKVLAKAGSMLLAQPCTLNEAKEEFAAQGFVYDPIL